VMRLLITFCVGVAAILAWQSYGNAAREIIASSYPQLGWLAPQAAVAQTAPDTIAPTKSSPDPQELKVMSADVAAVRQKVDQLAAKSPQARNRWPATSLPSCRPLSRTSLTRFRRGRRPLLRFVSQCRLVDHPNN
jgi:hypothetical protein